MRLATMTWPIAFDLYLLRFNQGSEIPLHTDEVSKGQHHRINIILKNADIGGDFVCKKTIFESSRIKYFRPDISAHQVTKIIKGKRIVLSIGWLRPL